MREDQFITATTQLKQTIDRPVQIIFKQIAL